MQSNKFKIILSVVLVLILMGGLGIGVFLVRQQQDIREKAAPATSLTLFPSNQSKNPGNSVNFVVKMNTGVNQVLGFQIDLDYDPSVLQVNSVAKGSQAANFDQAIPTNKFDNTTGKLQYSFYTLDKSKYVTGNDFEILTISAQVKDNATPGTYQISFTSSTAVSGINENQNVLTNATPATLVVASFQATPTPTPGPTDNNTAGTPTPTPTGSPTPTPTPTATSNANVGGATTPTPTPTVRATATSTPQSTPAEELPETGLSLTTILVVGAGVLLLITASLALLL